MGTFVRANTEGKIQSPDLLKIRIGNQILTFANKQTREMDCNKRIENNQSALSELQQSFSGLAEELCLEDEDDVMALIREIRYNEPSVIKNRQ